MAHALVDVKKLIGTLSLSELNTAADEYWKRMISNPRIATKPFNRGEAEHILPQLGFLIQGLQLYPGMTVLDFGAGSCYASRILNQMELRVISTDVSQTALRFGEQMAKRWPAVGSVPEHVFMLFDGQRFDLPEGSVDRIFSLEALHHVPYPDRVLREMSRILKQGGIAGFAEPGPNHSQTSEAQLEMRTGNVVENDILLEEIYKSALNYGFTDLRVAIATIHPPLVPLHACADYFEHAAAFVDSVRQRTTNFPIFFLYKGDPTIRDSRVAEGLCAKIVSSCKSIKCAFDEPIRVRLNVTNTSSKQWLPSGPRSGSVNIGAVLRDSNISGSPAKEFRFSLSMRSVEPGETISGIELDFGAPPVGDYTLDIDLVSENVCWFQSQSGAILEIDVAVR